MVLHHFAIHMIGPENSDNFAGTNLTSWEERSTMKVTKELFFQEQNTMTFPGLNTRPLNTGPLH